MPHFTLQTSPQGAVIDAWIAVSAARHAALTEAALPIPNPIQIRALIDTGATSTCIDPSVLQTLNLTPTGSTTVETPSTGGIPVSADQYDIGLIVPAGDKQRPLMVPNLPVICMTLFPSMGYHALIGRDVLAQCVFSYNGSMETFMLAY